MSSFLPRWRDLGRGPSSRGDKRRVDRNRRALSLEVMEARTLMTGTVTPLVNSPPNGSGTMMLETNGDVIMVGGGDSASNQFFVLTPDSKGNYVDGKWSEVASDVLPRLFNGSVILPDGRLIELGGEYSDPNSDSNDSNEGEIYNPSTNTWSTIATFPEDNFGDGSLINLGNGTVLAAYLLGPEMFLYNANNNTWSQTGTKLLDDRSDEEGFVRLADGSILDYDIEGSIFANAGHAQRYIPSTGTWVDAGSVPVLLSTEAVGEELGAGLLLPDGRVFWMGGNGNTVYYTPSTNKWSLGPVVPDGLAPDDAPAAELPNGKILFSADTPLFTSPTHYFEFDPTTNVYTDISSEFPQDYQDNPAFLGRTLNLPNGQILISDGGNNLVLYTPDSGSLASNIPTIKTIAENANGSFTLTGTGINGNDDGSVYGDDAQMATNYPIVSLTNAAGQVAYATTSGFNYAVQQGATPLTTNFTLPVGLASGSYAVRVLANGSASAPTVLTIPTNSTDPAPTFSTQATATPNPDFGTTATLSALAADTKGEPSLTYTWAVTSTPAGVVVPSFAINGTNAAKNNTATFKSTGMYTFQVTATNLAGLSISSSVVVNVQPLLTSLALSPTEAQLVPNQTEQFSVASGLDQFGNQITASSLTWAVTTGGGTVTTSGLYTAPAAGTIATVKVSSGRVSASAAIYVLSSPWTQTDVGSPSTTGAAADNGAGTFTLLGAGTGISGTSDQFQLAYLTLTGNSTIIARVATLQNTGAASEAGVMFRTDTSAGSAYAMVAVTPTSGVTFQYRTLTGGNTITITVPGTRAPEYVKLVRTGNIFTGYESSTGTTWTALSAPVSITMASTFVGGMAVSSGNASTLNTSTFSNVLADSSPTIVTPASANPSPVKTTMTTLSVLGADSAGESALTYTWATTSSPGGAIPPTFATNGTNASKTDIVTFSKSGLYTFTVTLTNPLGYTATSAVTVSVIATQTSVKMTPTSVILFEGGFQQFTTAAYDQFGLKLAIQPQFTYSIVAGGAGGKISSIGYYTAPTNRTGTDYVNVTGAGTAAIATVQVIALSSGPITSNAKTLSGSQATVGSILAGWGSVGSAALITAADGLRLLPAGRQTDLPWADIRSLTVTLSQPEALAASDVKVTGIAVANYGPVAVSQVSGSTYVITLAQPITAADRVTLTIANSGIATYTRRIDVLPGDVNDDGTVDSNDVSIATGYLATTFIAADIFGDGVVSTKSVKSIQLLNGTTLPLLS